MPAALGGGVKIAHGNQHMINRDVAACQDFLDGVAEAGALDDVGRVVLADVVLESGAGAWILAFGQVVGREAGIDAEMGEQLDEEGRSRAACAGDNDVPSQEWHRLAKQDGRPNVRPPSTGALAWPLIVGFNGGEVKFNSRPAQKFLSLGCGALGRIIATHANLL